MKDPEVTVGQEEQAVDEADETLAPVAEGVTQPINLFNPSGKRGRREWTPGQRAAQAERAKRYHTEKPPLVPDSALPTVKADFDAGMTIESIGRRQGCSGSHIRNFLMKHGIDPRRSEAGKHPGRAGLPSAVIETIITEKAKGTPSKEIAEKLGRTAHAVDQKYSDLKKTGEVPDEHQTPEATAQKKKLQNELVSRKMKAFHASKGADEGPRLDERSAGESIDPGTYSDTWKPQPIDAEEWPDIQQMLASGRTREAIASDYDVPVAELNRFIERQLEAARESPGRQGLAAGGSPRAVSLGGGAVEYPADGCPGGYVRLAKAKLVTMFQDLLGTPAGCAGNGKEQLRQSAHRWFFGASDFEIWCDTAGYLPEIVREAARKLHDCGQKGIDCAPAPGERSKQRT